MNRKAQLVERPLMYYLFIAISIMVFLFGYKVVSDWSAANEQLDYTYVANTLAKLIKQSSSSSLGTVEEHTVALPVGVDHVCLVDRDKAISPFVSCLLNLELDKFEEKNIFFSPFQDFSPLQLNGFELYEKENPLCLKARKGKIPLTFSSKGKNAVISTFDGTRKSSDCVTVLFNAQPEDALDIVFLGFGYNDQDEFAKDVKKQVNLFLEIEPFKSNKEKLNFFRIDRFDNMGCSMENWISCDEFQVKTLASFCPNDYVVVLASRGKIRDALSPVRSSAVSNMAKINTADNDLVLLHEFGHLFGGLGDEYVDEKYYSNAGLKIADFPNCDNADCSKWLGMNGTGCYKGCSLSGYFRPTKDSLMRSLTVADYGIWNEKVLASQLRLYGGKQ